MSNQENEWMAAFQSGDSEALEKIYLMLKGPLYSFIFRHTRDEQLSIDVVQDAFIKLQRKKHQFNPEKGRLRSYLFQIGYRIMINKLNRRKKWQSILPFLTPLPKEELHQADRMTIREAVARLSDIHRSIIILFYYHDMTHEEISAILDIPKGTVKSRLHHAIKKLKEELGEDIDESRSL